MDWSAVEMSEGPDAEDRVWYCPNCGNGVLEDDLYCPRCGESVRVPSDHAARESRTPGVPAPEIYAGPRGVQVAHVDPGREAAPVGYMGFWIRLAAVLIDGVILMFLVRMIWFVASLPSWLFGMGIGGSFLFLEVVALPCLYMVILTGIWGQTLGKKILGIKVVDDEGQPPGLGKAIIREVIGKFISVVCVLIGFLVVVIHREKKAWHDSFAGTQVIRAR